MASNRFKKGDNRLDYNISEQDVFLFHQGTNYYSHQLLGCHYIQWKGTYGYRFAVWAPKAKMIHVVGECNDWEGNQFSLKRINNEGLWVGFFSDIPANSPYKYEITTLNDDVLMKSDPYARRSELRPATASVTAKRSTYEWNDKQWTEKRKPLMLINRQYPYTKFI